jgi:BirA family transcriptional regulator, biotin operon repressor / biotin---[acetyl-CoA-carboxylase] ligase
LHHADSFFKNIIRLSEVNSTNIYASQLINENKATEGTVIIAYDQISGKGQAENKWESEKGKNLTFSIILKPFFLDVSRQFLISKIVSLSILDFLKSLSIKNLSIKWPNDIYIDNNKIGGILIENSIKGLTYNTAIIGIGININQTKFSSSIPNPISLKLLLNKDFNIEDCLNVILEKLETWYNRLKLKNYAPIDNEYLNSIYNFNIWSNYLYQTQTITAKILGVNKYGILLLEKEDKTIIECDLKEIKYLF